MSLRAEAGVAGQSGAQVEDQMSIKTTVIAELEHVAAENHKVLPPLTDELVLLDSGLDSLAIAILVARLEETLGYDPFTDAGDEPYPVTLGDFIRFYERSANKNGSDSRQAG
jgi:acyl carrier protein